LSQQLQEAGVADEAAKQRLKEMDEAEKAAAEAVAAAKTSTGKGSVPASTMMQAIPLKLIGP
jgi:SOS response regulatory protein OraA/RecX